MKSLPKSQNSCLWWGGRVTEIAQWLTTMIVVKGDTRGQNQERMLGRAWELESEEITGACLQAGVEEAEGWDWRPESGGMLS